jgi:dolichol-phosphate mannosyltransferase
MPQNWSIILLCYNEQDSLENTIENIATVMLSKDILNYEIIVIDDGSTDNSPVILKTISKKYKQIKTITHQKNLGIGKALKTGYSNAKNEVVMAMCSDGQFHLNELLSIKTVHPNTIISFYRQKKEEYTLFRNFLSNFNKWLNKTLLGLELQDINWVKIYHKSNLDKIDIELSSSLIETEIVTKLTMSNIRIIEIPTLYLPRLGESPKGSNPKIISQAISELFKLIYIIRIKSFFYSCKSTRKKP